MQRGFATLEIILAALILALLMSAAIPNVARVIDTATLNYETKSLYSDLRYLQALGRLGAPKNTGMERELPTDEKFIMQLDPHKFTRQILRGTVPLREVHHMQGLKELRIELDLLENQITFDTNGKATDKSGTSSKSGNALSGNITLTSKRGTEAKIIFDSVGRIRGGRADE